MAPNTSQVPDCRGSGRGSCQEYPRAQCRALMGRRTHAGTVRRRFWRDLSVDWLLSTLTSAFCVLGWHWGGGKERHLGRSPVFRLERLRGSEILWNWEHWWRHKFGDDSDESRGTGRLGVFHPGDVGRMEPSRLGNRQKQTQRGQMEKMQTKVDPLP